MLESIRKLFLIDPLEKRVEEAIELKKSIEENRFKAQESANGFIPLIDSLSRNVQSMEKYCELEKSDYVKQAEGLILLDRMKDKLAIAQSEYYKEIGELRKSNNEFESKLVVLSKDKEVSKALYDIEQNNRLEKEFEVITDSFKKGLIPKEMFLKAVGNYFEKAKYIRREGTAGNYKYIYKESDKRESKIIDESDFYSKNKYNEGIELVPISEIEKFKEFDRSNEKKFGNKDTSLDNLEKEIKENGIKSPINLEIRDGKGLITEGNTRLAVAIKLGLKHIPVKIIASSKSWKGTSYEGKAKEIDKGDSKYNLNKQKERYKNSSKPIFDTPLEYGFKSVLPKDLKPQELKKSNSVLGEYGDKVIEVIKGLLKKTKESEKIEKVTQEKKIEKVMAEFKAGTLRSGSGEVVTDKDQALAIAYSYFKSEDIDVEKSIETVKQAYKDGLIDKGTLFKAINNYLEKGRTGTYGDNPTNRRLKRVGQKYGVGKQPEQADKKDKKQEEPTKENNGSIEEQAKNVSGSALETASKEAKDPEVRVAAKKELSRREKEESGQDESDQPEKESIETEKKSSGEEGSSDKTVEDKLKELREGYKEVVKEIMNDDYSDTDKTSKLAKKQQDYSLYMQQATEMSSLKKEEEMKKALSVIGLKNEKEMKDFFGDGNIIGISTSGNKISILSDDGYFSRTFSPKENAISMDIFILNPEIEKGSGKGTEIFNNQIQNFKKKGFKKLTTDAAKGVGFNGYYTWARLGYDFGSSAVFEDLMQKSNNKKIKDVKTLPELMSFPEGREYWKQNGFAFSGEFDLSDNSPSMFMLENYMKEKKNGKK